MVRVLGLAPVLASPLFASRAYAQVESAATRDRAVARLRALFVATLGRSTAERLRLANSALAGADPFDASSLLVEIAAIGVIVRAQPVQDSVRARYPSRSKSAIERATAAFPETPWMLALTGAWHYEVTRRSSFGAMMLGANRDEGRSCFARAVAAPETDPGVRVAYAISLLSDPRDGDAAMAASVLNFTSSASGSADTPDSYRATVLRHAEDLRSLLQTRSLSQVQTHVLESY